jgi:hypothetical protein
MHEFFPRFGLDWARLSPDFVKNGHDKIMELEIINITEEKSYPTLTYTYTTYTRQ